MKDLIYFDTCILLDSISYRQGFTKFNSKRKFDIGQINPSKAEIFISDILLIEIAEKEGCNIFVTSDKKFSKSLRNLLSGTSSEKEISILNPIIFKNRYLENLS